MVGGRCCSSWERMDLAWVGVVPVLRRVIWRSGVGLGSVGGIEMWGIVLDRSAGGGRYSGMVVG